MRSITASVHQKHPPPKTANSTFALSAYSFISDFEQDIIIANRLVIKINRTLFINLQAIIALFINRISLKNSLVEVDLNQK
jgi:hypothetical protein